MFKLSAIYRVFFCCLFIFLCACDEKENKLPVDTPITDSVIKNAERVYDAGNKTEALAMVIAAHLHEKNLSVAEEINYYVYCAEIYRNDFKDYDKYMSYSDSIIRAIEKNHQAKELWYRYIQAFNMKADGLFSKGFYNESYDYYYKAKELAKSSNDTTALSQVNYSLGMVLYRQQRFREAADHFLDAYHEAAHLKDAFIYFYRKQELLDNIGLCYFHLCKYDSAMFFYNKAIACVDSNYLRFDKSERFYISAKAVVYGNMADLYMVRKRYDTAAVLLTKSISVNLQKGYINSDAILTQVKLASLFFKTENIAGMRSLLQDIKAELDTIPDKQVQLSWNKLMWQYYDHEKDYSTAYTYLKAYELMNDTLAANNNMLIASDVGEKIKGLEKQYQITILNNDKFQAKMYLIAAAVIILMAIIIILLAVKNAKRSRKNVEDLTLLYEEINRKKTELELKDKDKSRIMRSAAHDIINPVAAISGLAGILKNDDANLNPSQKQIISLIKESSDNSISISRDILEAATETDKNNLPKEPVNINKLLASCIDLLSMRTTAKNQHFIFTSNKEDIEAYVNKEKIWRVMNNLISNAIKFSYENSAIEIHLELIADNVHISVKDTGVGIPEKNKPLIFDVFTEARTVGTSGERPHGLGLSISMQIAKAHNGRIWFESEEGKGSTFHFEFPVNNR